MKCINSATPDGNGKAKAKDRMSGTGTASEKKTDSKTGK